MVHLGGSNELEHHMNDKISYTIKETAKASGLGRTTIYKLIGEGRLAMIKVGRRSLISAASLEELLRPSDDA